VLRQHAKAVSNVLEEMLDRQDSATLAALLLDLIHASQLPQGGVPGLPRPDSSRRALLHLFLEMKANLVVQLLLDGAPAEQGSESKPQDVRPARHCRPPQSVSRTRPMAAESLRQLVCSRSRYFRPVGVSE